VLAAALACCALPASASAGYEVGAAHRDLNPTAAEIRSGKVYLGGFGATGMPPLGGRHATGILGEGPSVGAFVVGDGNGGALAIADIEVQGWFAATKDGPYGLVDMRRAVAARTHGALRADEVFIQSDHTHSGADAMGVWGGVPLSYRKRMFDHTVDAIVDAWDHRRPAAELVYGTADGGELLNNQFGYDPNNQEMDTEVRVLQARAPDGTPLATLTNFSAHADVLGSSNTKISGDWPQRLTPMVERLTGGTAVTTVGTLGRSQPKDRGCSDRTKTGDDQSLCMLDDYAGKVLAKVQQALANAQPIGGPVRVAAHSYLIEDPSSNPLLLGLLYAGDALKTPVNRSTAPPWMTGDVIGTVTGSAAIGDVLVSSVPGEIYPQIARVVRNLVGRKARGFLTLGLANDQLGYIIAPFPGAYPKPICATFFDKCSDTLPAEPGALPNDNYFFNVSHTMGERVICSLLRGAGTVMHKPGLRASRPKCKWYPNDLLLPPGADVKP
jgi:hypothetical protein